MTFGLSLDQEVDARGIVRGSRGEVSELLVAENWKTAQRRGVDPGRKDRTQRQNQM